MSLRFFRTLPILLQKDSSAGLQRRLIVQDLPVDYALLIHASLMLV